MTETLTVTQYDERLKRSLNTNPMLCDIFVVGEISEIKTAMSGHIYFTLKDQQATLRCSMWKSRASTLKFAPKIGMKVVAFGGADFYAPSASLSFIVSHLDLFGEGEQKKALEELTNKLLKEGLFDPERKRILPKYPRTIGVVTSATGAVIKDIIETARQRYPADILLAPANVQGDGADLTIIKGIEMLNRYSVDVIIVGRGGGSTEDLSAFNSEALVRAIAASKAPVISAVGHGTDKSLTDRVADQYADTPTQAAMFATPDLGDARKDVINLQVRARRALSTVIDRMRSRFAYPDARLLQNTPAKYIERQKNALDKMAMRMQSSMRSAMEQKRSSFEKVDALLRPSNAVTLVGECGMRIDTLWDRVERSAKDLFESKTQRLESLSSRLDSVNPRNVLRRGYSYISDDCGNTITSASALSKGTVITVRMRDGRAKAEVREVEKK